MEVLSEMSLQLHGRAGSRKGSWLQASWSDSSDKGLKLHVAQNSSVVGCPISKKSIIVAMGQNPGLQCSQASF